MPPRYERPPVAEVVMGVLFEPVPLSPVQLGAWWQETRRERYPIAEERPPLEPVLEEFGPPQASGPSFTFELSGALPTPATWFRSRDGSELLQVQRDRLFRNWSRSSDEMPYPSYDELRPLFEADFADLRAFVTSNELGDLVPTQCEITYINPIRPGPNWSGHGQLASLLAPWSGEYTEGFLPEPEDVGVSMRFRINDPTSGEPIGRLRVGVQPAWSGPQEPLLLLTLTARGRPLGAGVDGAMAFLDLGHQWIVNGFTTLTTVPMHDEWGRIS